MPENNVSAPRRLQRCNVRYKAEKGVFFFWEVLKAAHNEAMAANAAGDREEARIEDILRVILTPKAEFREGRIFHELTISS